MDSWIEEVRTIMQPVDSPLLMHVELDPESIETPSAWFDLDILLRTVPAVLFSREAY
ncbi:hypothetical protein [Pseudomonas abietaniphila]|uniref:hypothetical protein n=1 Tax=Pseudomonas abietaniphila TaxID=89065 RepID=UPI000A8E955B|nr:hypothetical protein [Pseudomonas abietaniphila]